MKRLVLVYIILAFCFIVVPVNGYSDGDEQSLTDVMKGWGSRNNPDEEVMKEYSPKVQSFAGTLVSIGIYILFGLMAVTTGVDLAFIGVPPLRGKLEGLISSEMKYVYNSEQTKRDLVVNYFKKRTYAIVITVVVMMLLLTTSIFTDFGFNIGGFVYEQFTNLTG